MCLNMTEVVEVNIQRPAKVVKTLAGIRGFLCFYFDATYPETVTCRKMVGDENITPTPFLFLAPGEEDIPPDSGLSVASLIGIPDNGCKCLRLFY